jgi:hypothetical protein
MTLDSVISNHCTYSQLFDRIDTVLSALSSRGSHASSQVGGLDDLVPRVLERAGEEVHDNQRRPNVGIDPIESGELNENSDGSDNLGSSEYLKPSKLNEKT